MLQQFAGTLPQIHTSVFGKRHQVDTERPVPHESLAGGMHRLVVDDGALPLDATGTFASVRRPVATSHSATYTKRSLQRRRFSLSPSGNRISYGGALPPGGVVLLKRNPSARSQRFVEIRLALGRHATTEGGSSAATGRPDPMLGSRAASDATPTRAQPGTRPVSSPRWSRPAGCRAPGGHSRHDDRRRCTPASRCRGRRHPSSARPAAGRTAPCGCGSHSAAVRARGAQIWRCSVPMTPTKSSSRMMSVPLPPSSWHPLLRLSE